jgi:hypothetical protein
MFFFIFFFFSSSIFSLSCPQELWFGELFDWIRGALCGRVGWTGLLLVHFLSEATGLFGASSPLARLLEAVVLVLATVGLAWLGDWALQALSPVGISSLLAAWTASSLVPTQRLAVVPLLLSFLPLFSPWLRSLCWRSLFSSAALLAFQAQHTPALSLSAGRCLLLAALPHAPPSLLHVPVVLTALLYALVS